VSAVFAERPSCVPQPCGMCIGHQQCKSDTTAAVLWDMRRSQQIRACFVSSVPAQHRVGVAFHFDGVDLPAETVALTGCFVAHSFFWKSQEVRAITPLSHDEPGFWGRYGHHNYGDPRREQQYSGD
jgi:hypothetical protein